MPSLIFEKPVIRDSELLKKKLSQMERGSDLRDKKLLDTIRNLQNEKGKQSNINFRIFIGTRHKFVKYILLSPIPIKKR
ncbi:hypothetical protein Dtox_2406 [Desulfofarcimen acetoxidans DSM 771]|jgi:hypothetical protein|uniref:Uncharacterized protein n=1 Tax=Desulfofarcimen acetoxidans (strain ATCC 49208 / DSM 771 / KCTC 5769 / VKM B-1644 / 5575) TaxID=485916 RepID=C8W0G2_DESAS|nr:hypothetical protein [Desulfofarcimen acetoxidans]ACV63217.1 hypothetical protein Dtox_2406 [Desulfofarcimen acetoxidans DSM 771]